MFWPPGHANRQPNIFTAHTIVGKALPVLKAAKLKTGFTMLKCRKATVQKTAEFLKKNQGKIKSQFLTGYFMR
jgi:hypothetical protein